MIRRWGASVQTVEEGMLAMQASTCTDAADDLQSLPAGRRRLAAAGRAKNNVRIIVRLPLASGLLSRQDEQDDGFRAAGSPDSTIATASISMSARRSQACRSRRASDFADEIKHLGCRAG